MRFGLLVAGLLVAGMAGCVQPPPASVDNCTNADGAFNDAAFVVTTDPVAGARVSSGFGVTGCSRTFESTVVAESVSSLMMYPSTPPASG